MMIQNENIRILRLFTTKLTVCTCVGMSVPITSQGVNIFPLFFLHKVRKHVFPWIFLLVLIISLFPLKGNINNRRRSWRRRRKRPYFSLFLLYLLSLLYLLYKKKKRVFPWVFLSFLFPGVYHDLPDLPRQLRDLRINEKHTNN